MPVGLVNESSEAGDGDSPCLVTANPLYGLLGSWIAFSLLLESACVRIASLLFAATDAMMFDETSDHLTEKRVELGGKRSRALPDGF